MVSDLWIVPALLVTLGFVGLYTGWKRRDIHAQMANIDPTPVRELASPETVELEGNARPIGEPFTAPLTDREAVVAAWKVEEWDERGDHENWREVARGVEIPRFELDDGSGIVEIEPVSKRDTAGKWTQTTGVSAADGVRLDDILAEFDSFPVQEKVDPDEEPPEGVRRLEQAHDLYEDTESVTNVVDIGKKHGRRRYFEQVIEPGTETYVLGHVQARDDHTREHFRPEDAAITEPDEGVLLISNQDEASLEDEFAASAKARLAGGTVSLIVGLATALVLFGMF